MGGGFRRARSDGVVNLRTHGSPVLSRSPILQPQRITTRYGLPLERAGCRIAFCDGVGGHAARHTVYPQRLRLGETQPITLGLGFSSDHCPYPVEQLALFSGVCMNWCNPP